MRQPLVLCLFALAACSQESQTCTTQALASVEVTVVDEQGAGIDDPVVTWGKNLEETACESEGDVIVCGWEVDGTLRITADAESIDSAWASIKIPADDGPPLPCQGTADTKVFECWDIEPGKVDVLDGAPGYSDERVQIEIVEDDCGVVTYEQRFKLNRE